MHGTGVDRALDHGRRFVRAEIGIRIGKELRAAALGAEIVNSALILRPMLRPVRIDVHSTDRVFHRRRTGFLVSAA